MKYFNEENIKNIYLYSDERFIIEVQDNSQQKNRDRFYLMDRLGRIFGEPFEFSLDFGEEFLRRDDFFDVKRQGIRMLIDKFGNEFIRDFEFVSDFLKEGIATVKWNNGKCELITKNKEVFSDEFADYGVFAFGLCPVKKHNGKYNFIDINKNIKTRDFEQVVASFSNPNYTLIADGSDYYVIDRLFRGVSGPYKNVFFDEFGNVWSIEGLKFSLYKPTGELLAEGDAINGPDEGTYLITKEGKRYFIDGDGKRISKRSFTYAESFKFGMAPAYNGYDSDGEPKYTVLKKNGTSFNGDYSQAIVLGENLVALYVNGKSENGDKYYLYDSDENQVSRKGYRRPSSAGDGLFAFEASKDKYTYARINNLTRFKSSFDSASSFKFGYGMIKNNGIVDAVNTDEIFLSDISKFAKVIDNNPLRFKNLPQEIKNSERLYLDFYNQAQESVKRNYQNSVKENALRKLKEEFERTCKSRGQGTYGE